MAIKPLQFGPYCHIYNRGNNRENLFIEPRNYPYFLKLVGKYILPIAQIFAYCLLPNHFHLLIRTYSEEEQEAYWRAQIGPFQQIGPFLKNGPIFKLIQPSRAFNNMFIAYTRAVNKATGRTGALFERPFGRKRVTSEAYLQTLVVYIHQNPQKHGFVDDFGDWKYTSYSAFQSDKPTQLQRADVLDWFGGAAAMNDTHLTAVDEKCIAVFIEDDDF